LAANIRVRDGRRGFPSDDAHVLLKRPSRTGEGILAVKTFNVNDIREETRERGKLPGKNSVNSAYGENTVGGTATIGRKITENRVVIV